MKKSVYQYFKDPRKMRIYLEKVFSSEQAYKYLNKHGEYIGGRTPYRIRTPQQIIEN